MAVLRLIWQCMFTPKLYKKYGEPPYQPHNLERWGDQVINSVLAPVSFVLELDDSIRAFEVFKKIAPSSRVHFKICLMLNVSMYSSPILASFMYRRGYLVLDGLITVAKMVTILGLVLALSYWARAVGRADNRVYEQFQAVLADAMKNLNDETKRSLARYDFDFRAWPVDFSWNDTDSGDGKQRLFLSRPSTRRSAADKVISLPCQIMAYVAMHTFGIRLMYPGSSTMLQFFLFPAIQDGRYKLVEQNHGRRYKLRSRDGNEVDTMFVDQRGKVAHGDTLVICSEGNTGFYEAGIVHTPINAGYSVLGWNHPGFAGSTGSPYPDQELNAMDVVMQFAIHGLNFTPENILLFGWSIGGYPASWAAMNYPDVGGVILDASFDDILPLALTFMPKPASLVRRAIREHANLVVHEQLAQYPGPVLLVRRTQDEIICTQERNLSSNRGNDLLVRLLKARYPNLLTPDVMPVLNEWLAVEDNSQTKLCQKHRVDEASCTAILTSYYEEHSNGFPMMLGEDLPPPTRVQLVLFLAGKYMVNLRASHCALLPESMFRPPWRLVYEPDFVQI